MAWHDARCTNLIPATVIGSWSFPGWYEKFVARRGRRILACSARSTARRPSATPCGWPSTTSSAPGSTGSPTARCSRVDFNLGFYDYLDGLEPLARARLWGPPAHDQRSKYVCVGAARGARGARRWSRSSAGSASSPTSPAKMPVPGPFTLAGCIAGGRGLPRPHGGHRGPDPDRQRRDAGGRGRRESTSSSSTSRASPATPTPPRSSSTWSPGRSRGSRRTISMHMCFGNYRGAGGRLAVVPAAVPAHRPGEGQPACAGVRQPGDGRDRAARANCPTRWTWPSAWSTSRTPGSSRPELVAERLRTVLRMSTPERVSVTPDCGFSQTARHVAMAKARKMVEGVRVVRGELGREGEAR